MSSERNQLASEIADEYAEKIDSLDNIIFSMDAVPVSYDLLRNRLLLLVEIWVCIDSKGGWYNERKYMTEWYENGEWYE